MHHHLSVEESRGNWLLDFPFQDLDTMLNERPLLFANRQVAHLAAEVDVLALNPTLPYHYDWHTSFLEFDTPMEQLFETACRNLEQFHFVGFQEQYEQSLTKLCDLMDWERPPLPHLNKLPGRPQTKELPASTLRKIDAINEWDFKLYEFAVRRFPV